MSQHLKVTGSADNAGLVKGEDRASAFRREMERAFDRAWREFERHPNDFQWPPIDVVEDEKSVTLRIDVPGMEPKDVDVEVSGNQITVRGQREEKRESRNGGHRQERYTGSFYRTVTLPAYADTDKTDARYDKGVLTVSIPKIPGKGPKHVAVKA